MIRLLSRDEVVQLAVGYADLGFLCSEAVLLAMSRCQAVASDLIPRMATGFGAGVGRKGEVCGALSGGVMGLGLSFGRSTADEGQGEKRPYRFATELMTLFRERLGHVRCRDLLGLDLSDTGDLQAYREKGMWGTRCREIIATASGLAYDILATFEGEAGDAGHE